MNVFRKKNFLFSSRGIPSPPQHTDSPEVYANMTIENFERAASIVPFSIAEKWMANAARQQGINIQINYREQAHLHITELMNDQLIIKWLIA